MSAQSRRNRLYKISILFAAVMLAASCGPPEEQLGSVTLTSHNQRCRPRGPDYCSGLPNATHCHVDNSDVAGICHNGRCLATQAVNYEGDDDGDVRECPLDAGMPPALDAAPATPDAACNSSHTDASTDDAGGVGGSSGTGGTGGEAGVGGSGGEAGAGGAGGDDVGGTITGPSTIAADREGRVGWGCSASGGNTPDALSVIFIAILAVGFVRRRLSRVILILPLIFCVASARAESGMPKLRLNVDLVGQTSPEDEQLNGNTNLRLGGELGVEVVAARWLDVGAKLSIGQFPGLRFVGSIHTDRSQRALNPFIELRAILHPQGGDVGFGPGAWLGATYELGPGRLEFGPALEAYTSPDSARFRNYALLGIVGYQFDFGSPASKPVASTPVELPKRPPAKPAKAAPPKAEVVPPPSEALMSAKVLFDFDSANLRPEAKIALDTFAAKLPTDGRILVVGHTCSIGTDAYNHALGLRRAKAVALYIHSKRLDLTIFGSSEGESQPEASNATKAGRAANRRVMIVLIKD